jgi:hypothetical protein
MMPAITAALDPCPFCAGIPNQQYLRIGFITCSCGAEIRCGFAKAAIAAWNRRAAICSPEASSSGPYLIWSNEHRVWWAADERGYTQSVERAGRYSRAVAMNIAGCGRGGWAKGENPSEIAIPENDAVDQSTHPLRLEAWAKHK